MTASPSLDTIFSAAIELPSPADRAAYIAVACGDDAALRVRVEELVAAYFLAGRFLDDPALDLTATLEQAPAECPGTMIGPYRLMEEIGEGGMGVVFVAEQHHPVRRKVALKLIKPGMDTREVSARFEAERQALALMDHPHIAKVLDAGVTDRGRPFFVMELVRGIPVTDYCDRAHMGIRDRLHLFIQVCQAVQHAHQKGIIHRDLKPSNVLVTEHDGTPVAKVIDFGVAKAVGQSLTDKTVYTRHMQLVGSPLYMSPEQAGLSGLDVDTRADIYALGVLLYELLTGTTPFDKERFRTAGYDEVRQIIRDEEPPRPSTRLSTLGPTAVTVSANRQSEPRKLTALVRGELDWLVMKALEKDRNRRYESAAAFAADVQRYLNDEPVLACPPSAWYRLRKFSRRNKRALVSAALLVGMLLVLFGGLGWVASDRAARRGRAASEVNQFLQQAESQYADNKLPEARAEVQKARVVLETVGGGDDLHLRVRQWLTDLETATKLEEILMELMSPTVRDRLLPGSTEPEPAARSGVDAGYARVFRDYGIDVETLTAEEAATRIADSHIKLDLVLALDRWAESLRSDPSGLGPARSQRLQAIARAADPDPWRHRFNAAAEAKDLKTLRELADGADRSRLRTRVLVALGDSLRAAGDVEASVAFLRTVQRLYPADYSINVSLAWSLRNLNPPQWDEAIAYRRIAVAVRPQSSAANWYLGWSLHWQQGKPDEAMAYYRTTFALDPGHAAAHFSLALALRARGRTEEALVHYRTAADLVPNDPQPRNNLAWVLATCADPKFRDPAQAVTLAKNAVELAVKQGDARDKASRLELGNYWSTLGVAHYQAGNLEEASAALQKSLDNANGADRAYVCENWIFLAMVNWKQDRKDKAREWYDRAADWVVKKKPKEEEIRRFRAEAATLMGIEEKE
ncbi:MAG TPA: protein kinase [Gemmataceae bacterium]|nr:protein kinase [Gemmataceae bacterium]